MLLQLVALSNEADSSNWQLPDNGFISYEYRLSTTIKLRASVERLFDRLCFRSIESKVTHPVSNISRSAVAENFAVNCVT